MAGADYPWLLADIGGTNARFGLVHADGAALVDVVSFTCGDHESPQAAAGLYLEQLTRRDGKAVRPQSVALALATPIDGDTVKMTNSAWIVSRAELANALGARRVLLLNDFEALALALPQLGDEQTWWLGAARANRRWPMAVIGPGTGLGVSSCVLLNGGWIALPAEGGHVTAAAADDFEGEVLRVLRAELGHVSAEHLLSGIGLPRLYRAVCTVRGAPCQPLDAEAITRAARERNDADCLAALDTFCAMLGTFAGNVALTVGARGGVFVAGGIVPKLGEFFFASRFRERFEAKGRFAAYMARIATGLITAPHAALTGAAHALAQAGAKSD
ncbi:MAG TPA: glucokinase [Burkholderiaceae bacterium]